MKVYGFLLSTASAAEQPHWFMCTLGASRQRTGDYTEHVSCPFRYHVHLKMNPCRSGIPETLACYVKKLLQQCFILGAQLPLCESSEELKSAKTFVIIQWSSRTSFSTMPVFRKARSPTHGAPWLYPQSAAGFDVGAHLASREIWGCFRLFSMLRLKTA